MPRNYQLMRRLPAIAAGAILASGSAIASLGTAHAAPNNFQDLDAALNYAVDKDVAPIITN